MVHYRVLINGLPDKGGSIKKHLRKWFGCFSKLGSFVWVPLNNTCHTIWGLYFIRHLCCLTVPLIPIPWVRPILANSDPKPEWDLY